MKHPDLNFLLRSEPEAKRYYDALPDYVEEQIGRGSRQLERAISLLLKARTAIFYHFNCIGNPAEGDAPRAGFPILMCRLSTIGLLHTWSFGRGRAQRQLVTFADVNIEKAVGLHKYVLYDNIAAAWIEMLVAPQ